MGTWENGVFDYDHLKKSYLPSYTRFWDESSKVPFLYNTSTGIWISYDDVQSIQSKSEYIKREELAGAMFWELSGDRDCDLIDVAFDVLNKNEPKSPPKVEEWMFDKDYHVEDRVMFQKNTYECLLAHKSGPGWSPAVVPALWKCIE